jgi:hypothetical protein
VNSGTKKPLRFGVHHSAVLGVCGTYIVTTQAGHPLHPKWHHFPTGKRPSWKFNPNQGTTGTFLVNKVWRLVE